MFNITRIFFNRLACFSYICCCCELHCFQENASHSMCFFAFISVASFYSIVVYCAISKVPNHQIATGMRMQIASINWKINCCVGCLFLSYSYSISVLVIHEANFRKWWGKKWKKIHEKSFEPIHLNNDNFDSLPFFLYVFKVVLSLWHCIIIVKRKMHSQC